MNYLLIIFIIALALAPLTQVLPSKSQRRVARLREFAALQGMFVEFRPAPEGILSSREASAYQRGKTIYYGLRIPASARGVRPQHTWVYGEQGWRSLPRGTVVPEPLQDLPAEIFALRIDSGSCGIYWQEDGEEAEIRQIYEVLCALRDAGQS